MIRSARRWFMIGHDVHFVLFTDDKTVKSPDANIHIVAIEELGWPDASLLRARVYHQNRSFLRKLNLDYVYATDSDMRFVDHVNSEIFGERVATMHVGFSRDFQNFEYETDPKSAAFIAEGKGQFYFAGGLYGGSLEEFIRMTGRMTETIELDLSHEGYIAKWHDESHLNRFFAHNKPTLVLPPSYCFPEFPEEEDGLSYVRVLYQPKLLALDKNHKEMRT